jgi:hypothetical protein
MRRHLLVGLGLVALAAFWMSACQSEIDKQAEASKQAAIKAEAKIFLATFSVPGPETEQIWRMKEFRIIAWGLDYAVDNDAEINGVVGQDKYALAIPLWCKGKSLEGEPLKLRRTLHLKAVSDDKGATWRIESPEFRDDKPLTFLRQLLTWLFWTFVVLPVMFFTGLLLMYTADHVGFLGGLFNFGAFFGVLVFPLLLPAVFAWAFFDSVVFTVICLLVSILVTIRIIAALPET